MTDLVCPACRRRKLAGTRTLRCAACGARYPVEGGIPVLLAGGLTEEAAAQASHFDEAVDDEYEIERPLGTPAFHGRLLAEKFRSGISEVRGLLPGGTALAVCGGSGLDAEFLARSGASVATVDVSLGAARRARERAARHGLTLETVVADAQALPFRDGSFDLVYVHDGLHHVDDPLVALAEMARVARTAVSVTEPARAAATAAAVRVGLALEQEQAGNRVRRLAVEEVTEALRDRGFEIVRARRYAMLYRHEPGPVSHLLSRRRLLPAATRAQLVAARLAGHFGNKLSVQAVRRQP